MLLSCFTDKTLLLLLALFCSVVFIVAARAEHRQQSGGGRPHIGGAGRGVSLRPLRHHIWCHLNLQAKALTINAYLVLG